MPVVTMAPTTPVYDAIQIMVGEGFRRVPIVDPGTKRLQGIITATDIINYLGGGERFEIIQREPLIILDGAHNPDGAKRLNETLKEFVNKNVILVVGVASDKDASKILKELVPLANFVIITRAKYKGTSTKILEELVAGYDVDYRIIENVEDAFNFAKSFAKKNGIVCVAGSLYVVGEVKEAINCTKKLQKVSKMIG